MSKAKKIKPWNDPSRDTREFRGSLLSIIDNGGYRDEDYVSQIATANMVADAVFHGKAMYTQRANWGRIRGITPEAMIDKLTSLGGRLVYLSFGDDSRTRIDFVWPHVMAEVRISKPLSRRRGRKRGRSPHINSAGVRRRSMSEISVRMFGTVFDDSIFKSIRTFVKRKYVRREPLADQVKRKIFRLGFTKRGLCLTSMGTIGVPLERGNYSQKVLEDFDHVVGDISDPDPCGRLVLIHGNPGTGKTYFVQGLIEGARNVAFVLVPSTMIPHVLDPNLSSVLMRLKIATCLVIEDADDLLIKREMSDNRNGVTSLLNLAAGIFGVLADVRVVCTTNVKNMDMDPAIERPMRLCRKIEIPELDEEKAAEVYTRLTGMPRQKTGRASLGAVYKEAREARRPRVMSMPEEIQ